MQKERELKFPFQITEDGEIELTEELDREEKDMVSGRLKQSVHSVTVQKNTISG